MRANLSCIARFYACPYIIDTNAAYQSHILYLILGVKLLQDNGLEIEETGNGQGKGDGSAQKENNTGKEQVKTSEGDDKNTKITGTKEETDGIKLEPVEQLIYDVTYEGLAVLFDVSVIS